MDVGLHRLAARGGDVEAAAQEGRQFGAVAALGPLHGDGQPLEHAAELHGDEGVERHVEGDGREGQHGAAIGAEEFAGRSTTVEVSMSLRPTK